MMQMEVDQNGGKVTKAMQKKYRAMIARVIPGEVVIPADSFKDFIESSFIQRREDFQDKNRPTLNELLTIRFKGGALNVRSFLKESCESYYQNKEDGFRLLEERLKGDDKITPEQREQMLSFYRALIPKLEVYYSRIPATMPSAGSVGEVLAITYDSRGIIYTSPVKNLLDGSDYDVDTLTMYMRAHKLFNETDGLTDEDGNPLPEKWKLTIEDYNADNLIGTSNDGINNYIFDTMFAAYVDTANLDYTIRALDIKDMKDRVQAKKDKDIPHFYDAKDNVDNFMNAHEGKNMVSRMANAIQAYSRMMHLPENVRKSVIRFPLVKEFSRPAEEAEERRYFIIENIAKLLQASVDNAKELIIGYLNINTTSANMVNAMALSNMTLEEIYQFLETPTVVASINEAMMSESAENIRTSLLDIVERKLKTYESMFRNDENGNALEDRKAQYRRYHEEAAAYYQKVADALKDKPEGDVTDSGDLILYDKDIPAKDVQDMEMRMSMPTEEELLEQQEAEEKKRKSKRRKALHMAQVHRTKLITGDGGFDTMVNRMETAHKQLSLMQEMAMKGEALRMATRVFSLASGHTGTDFDTYRQTFDLNWIMGQSIDDLLSDESRPTDGWRRSIQFKSNEGSVRSNYKVRTQEQLDTDMNKLFSDMFSDIKVPAGINISFIGNGSDGMGQALVNAASAKYPVKLNMAHRFRFKNKFGQILSNQGELLKDNVLSRFPRVKEEDVTASSSDVPFAAVNSNARKANLSIIVTCNQSSLTTEMKNTWNISGTRAVVMDMNMPLEAQVKAARERIEKALEDAFVRNDTDVEINLVGNTLFDLFSEKESPREAYERRQIEIRKMIDFPGLIKALPNIREYARQLNEFNKILSKVFGDNSPMAEEYMSKLFEAQRFEKAPSAEAYYKVKEAYSAFIADMFFRQMKEADALVSLTGVNSFGMLSEYMDFDMRDKNSRDMFTQYFPQYMMDLKNSGKEIAKNGFIKELGLIDQNLGMPDNLSFSPDKVLFLTKQFKRLEQQDPDLARLLHYYNLMRYKFEFKKGSMTQMMGTTFMRKITPVIDTFNEMLLQDNDPVFRKALMSTGIENVLAHYPELWRWVNFKQLGANDIFPLITYQSRYGYRQMMIKEKNRPLYEQAWDMSSNKDHSLSPTRSSVSVRDKEGRGAVIHLQGQDLLSFMKDGYVTRKTRRKHNYTDGQIVYVNGVESRVSTVWGDPRSITIRAEGEMPNHSRQLNMKAQRLNARSLSIIVNRIKELYPKVNIRIVNNATTRYPGEKGYVEDGVMCLNSDLVTYDTPIHELGHIMLGIMEGGVVLPSIHESIMALADQEIDTNSQLYQAVKAKYPELKEEDMRKEMAATILGFRSVNQVMKYVSQNQTNIFMKVAVFVKEAYDTVMNMLLRCFGYTKGEHLYQKISRLNAYNATMGTIVDTFIGDILDGKINMPEADANTFMAMQAWHSRDLSKGMTNIREFENDLLTNVTGTDVNTLKEETAVNSIFNDVLLDEDNKYNLFGKNFDLKEHVEADRASSDTNYKQTKDYIRKEMVPMYQQISADRDTRIQRWLSSDNDTNGFGRLDEETLKSMFTYGDSTSPRRMFGENYLRQLRTLFGWNPGDKVVRYSKLGEEFPHLAGCVDPALVGNDPWVIVHKDSHIDGKPVLDISLFDLSYMKLNFRPTHNNGTNILANYIDDSQANSIGIDMKCTLKSVKKLQLGMTALKIAEMNPELNIRRIGVIYTNRGNAEGSLMDMSDLARNLFLMRNVPAFMERIPESARALLEKDSLRDRNYSPDFVLQLFNMMEDNMEFLEQEGKSSVTLENQVRVIREYAYSPLHTVTDKKGLIAMLRTRKNYLKARYKLSDFQDKEANDQYKFISKVLNEVVGFDRDPFARNTGQVNRFNYILQNLSNVSNEVEQNLYGLMKDVGDRISGLFIRDFKDGLKDAWAKINDAYYKSGTQRLLKLKGLVMDDSEARCHNMWIWSDDMGMNIIDGDTGKKVNKNLRRIHWDKNDPVTAKKLRDHAISEEEVEAGAVIAQRVEDYIKAYFRHNLLQKDWNESNPQFWKLNKANGTREVDEDAIGKAVQARYNASWQKGMMPVMSKSMSSMFFEGKFWTAVKMKQFQINNPQEIFDNIIQVGNEDPQTDGVRSIFQGQFENVQDNRFGGHRRMEMMGMSVENGQLVYRDTVKTKKLGTKQEKANKEKGISTDLLSDSLEHMLDNFGMDILSKIHLEADFMPAVEEARIALKAVEGVNNIDPMMSEKRIRTIVDKIVHNKMQPLDPSGSVAGKRIENYVNFMQHLTQFTGIAFSIPTAVTSLTGNLVQTVTMTLANDLGANVFDMFNTVQFAKAGKFMAENMDLCEQLMGMYQVADRDRYSLLRSSRYKETKNNFTNERASGYFNWLTDYSIRMQVMIAQMMYEGSLDAHSLNENGKVVYNEKQDRRFWNADGTQTASQRELLRWTKEELMADGVVRQEMDKPAVKAYMPREQRRMKWITDQFIIGGYTSDEMPAGMSHLEQKVLSQFRIFLYSMVESRFGGRKFVVEGGKPAIVDDGEGNVRRQWLTPEREGCWVSIYNMGKTIVRTHKRVKWENMSKMERHNLIRACQDMVVLCAAALFGWGMWDRDKKKGVAFVPEARLVRAVKNGIMSVISVNPMEAAQLTSNIPIVKTTVALMNLVTLRATQQDVKQLTPFKASYDMFTDFSDIWDDEDTKIKQK